MPKCIHGKRKDRCVDCGGVGTCIHKREVRYCKDCGGCGFCKHGKRKSRCKECGGYDLCQSKWCETSGYKKYNRYCLNCFIHLFPDKPVSRNYKTKEKTVADFILSKFATFTWVCDKTIADGCSKRRPDLLLDLGYQIIIIEIDENQHTDYDCSCENKRLMEISQDLNHRPIVFIRFNPDSYLSENGLVKSCWIGSPLHINRNKRKEWEDRLDALKTQVEYWSKNQTDKTVEIVELYYNKNGF